MTARLAAIAIYPVKSCAGIALDTAIVEPRGLHNDRRWLLVDPSGRFVTGRELPALVRVHSTPIAGGLALAAPGMPPLNLMLPASGSRQDVVIWNDAVSALDAGDEVAEWFSTYTGRELRLVHADSAMQRALDPKYARAGDETGFADGYPVLLVSSAAAAQLSARAGRDLGWRRFRPNLVIDGVAAHAEDDWKRVRVGVIEFDVVKPCVRCVFTRVDPDSGSVEADNEPLKTLKDYRRSANGITFGQNLIPRGSGVLRVGDAVEVLG